MKKPALLLLIPALFLVLASSAFADTLNFTATSSVNGKNFTLTFTEPGSISSLITTTSATLNFGALNFTDPTAGVTFFPSSDWGLMNVDLTFGGVDYLFEFFGHQSYKGTGPFTLQTGTFWLGGPGGNGSYSNSMSERNIGLGNGKIVVSNGTTPTPEPGTFALLGAGLAALGMLRRKLRTA